MMDENHLQMTQVTSFSDDLARRIQEDLGENVYLCYQCIKCTSGCPLTDSAPHA